MHPDNDHHDDSRFDELLGSLTGADLPPDEQFLRRLRDQSTETFEAAGTPKTQLPQRRHRMFILAWRTIAATLALAFGSTLWFMAGSDDPSLAFGAVLERLGEAETLHLEITRDGESDDVWVKRPGRLRWNHADGTYRIARGPQQWHVNEQENRASLHPAAYFGGEKPALDALALLDLPPIEQPGKLRARQPVEQVKRDGKSLWMYRFDASSAKGKIHIEAAVDVDTLALRWIRAGCESRPPVTLAVRAVSEPVDEELFVVGKTLTEDGRIGKVRDLQGIVAVRPVMHQRFTPVVGRMLVRPGDWLRTDARGANAMTVRLIGTADVTLGPGTLVEAVKPNEIRVHHGQLKIAAEADTPLNIIGPDGQSIQVTDTRIYRTEGQALVPIEKPPLWLQGFEGTTADESIGSLVVQLDGRSVPLTVGYHKVSVDIRDQIARTVIEESFVNHTAGRLEGVFHFPLPQDASISGFGMWIGNRLVEADVVEKQRAREIYETILRERRDPGLLEWAGGNIFKARVFPIEAHSEKRIKITYTQVLPMRGDTYRYSYALQSELLRQHPLRELLLDVKINSAVPLLSVKSPTHVTRTDRTQYSAHVEFSAQEYTPSRDFEVVVQVDRNRPAVVLIPHRRGEDGYFMLQVMPPTAAAMADREILPDGEPLDLLILADTSASIDAAGREARDEFLAALLGSLTPKDRFNLAVCDVDCQFAFEKSVPGEGANIDKARSMVSQRASLGWTDLDRTFAEALKHCGPKTHVIYIGDAVPAGKDSDPVALAKRLRLLWKGKPGTLHAVSVGSSFESVVLSAIASAGGGSMRQIGAEKGPRRVALELLGELAQGAVRDLKVELVGLQTARVYPERLPNLSAGMQQILLGRYLPEGKDQAGEVVVKGMQGDKPVELRAKVSLADAEQGNSFIPRLWARMHLDALLQQGSSPAVRNEIIGLSEEYHIITPYTSLLVLESDADRERFKVKRRMEMRDGERFFAEGRDAANYELMQQQMKRAGTWRTGLRRAVLQQLMGLGRNAEMFQAVDRNRFRYKGGSARGRRSGRLLSESLFLGDMGASHGWFEDKSLGLAGGSYFANSADSRHNLMFGLGANSDAAFIGNELEGLMATNGSMVDSFGSFDLANKKLSDFDEDFSRQLGSIDRETPAERENLLFDDFLPALESTRGIYDSSVLVGMDAPGVFSADFGIPALRMVAGQELSRQISWFSTLDSKERQSAGYPVRRYRGRRREITSLFSSFNSLLNEGRYKQAELAPNNRWFRGLFPGLPDPPVKPRPQPTQPPWPKEARELAGRLLRTEALARLEGGLRIERQADFFDVRFDELTSRAPSLILVSPGAWLIRTGGPGSQTLVNWCDGKQRAVLSRDFQLGRRRDAVPLDLSKPPLDISGYVVTSLEQTFRNYTAKIQPQGENRVELVLTNRNNPREVTRVLIDTERNVILQLQSHRNGKVTSTSVFSQFAEVAGVWWAGRIETTDPQDRRTTVITQKFTPLAAEPFAGQIEKELAGQDRVQFLNQPMVSVNEAKRALSDGKATFDDQIVMMLHFSASQQWERVWEHFEQAEKLAGEKPGLRWVRNALLKVSRRREELKGRMMAEAGGLAKPQAADLVLARYLVTQAGGILEANEMLALLDVLKPVYERQPPYLHAIKQWRQQQINYLRQTGQADEALRLRGQLAADYPRDWNLQQQYVQELINQREYQAASDWLDHVMATHEEESLRNLRAQLLRTRGHYGKLVEFLAEWVAGNPENTQAYTQYLTALIRTDRAEEAEQLVDRWLREGRVSGPLPDDVRSRLSAAISLAMGRGHNLHTNRIEQRWHDPLAETALFFIHHQHDFSPAEQIMGHGQFRRTDACRRVRREVAKILLHELDTVPADQAAPAVDRMAQAARVRRQVDRISRFVDWIWPNDPEVKPEVWKRIAEGLNRRWLAEKDPEIRDRLATPLMRILSSRVGAQQHLAFLREQLVRGPAERQAVYAGQLFNAVLGRPWSQAREDELFGLLEQLSNAEEPTQRLQAQVDALYRLTDRMVQARFQAEMGKVKHQEKLTRTELRQKQKDNMRAARQGFADRLQSEIANRPAELARWMNIERLYLDVLFGRNLRQVEAECWKLLGDDPQKAIVKSGPGAQLEAVFRQRLLTTITNLAVRKETPPESIERLLAFIERAVDTLGENAAPWKQLKYQLLIALDRPKPLEQALRTWLAADEPDHRWRLSLGYLLAEQGKFDEAVKQFEAVETVDELTPQHYRALANWYMVLDRRDQHERALVAVFKTMQEHELHNWLRQKLQPYQRREGQMPEELDKDVLRVFAALLQKADNPHHSLSLLRGFYRATHDFRLLRSAADAVVGHTAGRVYPFLGQMRSVLDEVRNEATADEMLEHLGQVRERIKTNVDRRAFDLLEMLVERRNAELINQPGPHVEKALAAMQRAFKGDWSSGEPRLMADFLAGLGHISQAPLADEQLRQLQALHRQAGKGTVDRLHIAQQLAQTVWSYSRQDEAIDLLQAALDEHRAAHGGLLPTSANGTLDRFVSYLEQLSHHARAEKVLTDQLAQPVGQQQRYWLIGRLYQVYLHALGHEGDVSIGSGEVLYRAIEKRIREELPSDDENHTNALVQRLCQIYTTAQQQKLANVTEDIRFFAMVQVPEILKRQHNNYESIVQTVAKSIVQTVANTLRSRIGPRDGLAFLVDRLEHEPAWHRYTNRDGWNRYGHQIAHWRSEAKILDAGLEERLLTIVTAELRRELQTRQSRNRYIYYSDHSYFWKEKAPAFAAVAEEVWTKNRNSGAAVQHIADYLYHGLDLHQRAIEILLLAHGQNLLDEGGQAKLARFLHEQNRHGESIAILQPMVKRWPNNIQYRVWLMHAYFRTERHEELLTLLKQTDEHFHQGGRWTEGAMGALAASCLQNQLFEQSVVYYDELIPLHQRSQPNRGIGNGTLSSYYRQLAQAHAGLKQTAKAVEAACGAIVSWGRRHDNRRQALETLKHILWQSPDLDAYAVTLDKQGAETGQDNRIVRKALGQAYFDHGHPAKALAQLKVAVALQPNDREIHDALIACHDRLEDRQGAITQMLALTELARRDIALYRKLGDRLKGLEQPQQSERAYTSIVEMQPKESESHALLAEIRQGQDRWADAADHWRQVAEIRALEPTGLLKLAAAQIHLKQWDHAQQTLGKLTVRSWPERFGDVRGEVRQLRQQIEKGRK